MNAPEPPRIAGPVEKPQKPRILPPPGAWDTHAHIMGPPDKFPYTAGRGYTPPDAPAASRMASPCRAMRTATTTACYSTR
jgi:2-pyrone-4,6-dicarboxylate lactonase